LFVAGIVKAQDDPIQKGLNAITKEAIKGQIEFLASDWTEGRETSTKGEFMAGDYIASVFQIYGVQPAGDMNNRYNIDQDQMYLYMSGGRPKMAPPTRSYFQNISFVETLKNESSMELITKDGANELTYIFNNGNDYSIWGSSAGMEINAPLVFIGYGFKNDSIGYDDFKGVEVKGKIVLRVNGLPGMKDTLSVAYKKLNLKDHSRMYKYYEAKDKLLEEYGAAGVIEIPSYGVGSTLANYPLRYNTKTYEGEKKLKSNPLDISLPVDTLSNSVARINISSKIEIAIMKGAGIDIKEYETNAAKLKPGSKEIKNKVLHLRNVITTQTVRGRNVLAMIEGENPNEVIVVGAHYDHLGISNGYIWNGADDNASGTVGVMTLAKAFMATGVKPKKTIIFAAWTGEEKGLLGSTYYVDKYRKKDNLVLNLNFDMISRRPEKDTAGFKAGMDYTKDCPILKDLVEKANTKYELGLEIDFKPAKRPQGGTDFTPFSMKQVPIYGFDAAFTSDYHGPMDHADKVNLDLMQKIIKVGFVSLFELANTEGKIETLK
ncbi:MAG: M20/M25/M40 family metallo-hydrolase, partial [Bacteroidales bacterium]|nr:M20/M25/M40 family metallo-hydrolase [Bacteroidales bacterium]